MTDEKHDSIADSQRSPATEAADKVDIGPSGTDPEDEERPEPAGTADSEKSKVGADGEPVVPPSRGTTH